LKNAHGSLTEHNLQNLQGEERGFGTNTENVPGQHLCHESDGFSLELILVFNGRCCDRNVVPGPTKGQR